MPASAPLLTQDLPKGDLHVHTSFSDGADSPEEVVREAIDRGMSFIGFSDHGYSLQDIDCCIPEDRVEAYKKEIRALREKYKNRIRILLGIEKDYSSVEDTDDYDYVIGSVHYIETEKGWYSVDWTPEILEEAVSEAFSGDPYALCEKYFETIADVVEKTGCDIIGHFDLVSKFSRENRFFDPRDERYQRAWKKAADRLLLTGKLFEINTGAIAKGYRTEPYPSMEIISYLKDRGAGFILSGDSHTKEKLMFEFEKWAPLAGSALLTEPF